jgi:hypothetical protein
MLTVSTSYVKKSAEIGAKFPHHSLAEQLLRDLVKQEKGRKGSTV